MKLRNKIVVRFRLRDVGVLSAIAQGKPAFYAALVTGLLLLEAASAQVPGNPARYPWDSRPAKCFAPAVEPVGMCGEQGNWPDFPKTIARVQSLLAGQDLTLLKKATADLALGDQKFTTSQYHFEAWTLAIASQLAYADDDMLGFIEDWRKSDGTASPALLVQAMALRGQAWRARGDGFANSVSPEAWQIFNAKLAQADTLLDSASIDLKRSGPWHLLKVQLAFDQPTSPAARLDLLKAASAAWPDSTVLYEAPMARSSPVWGGSFERMDDVARLAAQASRFRSSAAMYALVYERAFRGHPRYSLPSTRIDWSLAKEGFRDIEQSGQFPPWIWENFANLACQMRDRSEARRLYELNDRQTGETRSQPGADPCRVFANGN